MKRQLMGVAVAGLIVAAGMPTAATAAARPETRGASVLTQAQMTPSEFAQVKHGMTQSQVKAIVKSGGKITDQSGTCIYKQYTSGIPGTDYAVEWKKKSGTFRVAYKFDLGTFSSCGGGPTG